RCASDHLKPLCVGVLEHELIDAETVGHSAESVNQLGAVSAPATDDCDLHALLSAGMSSLRRCSRTFMRSIAVRAMGGSEPNTRCNASPSPVVLQPAMTASTPSVDTSSRGENGEIDASA